ncbi:MAG TPA: tRNA lysidine(34) synthetase TilS [Chitinophagaceae bacterium]|nr:tRNA lysidine(34) synthetase TilS [Chitinophagaceae bacterium]
MNLLQRYQEFIKKENLFSPKDKLMLAVSGGVDSVVLCELCRQAGYDFEIAHCNFQLRGEESERDEKFVRGLGEKYKVEVKVKKFDTERFAEQNKMSIQESARVLRYEWFEELVRSSEFRVRSQDAGLPTPDSRLRTFLLTAHHAGDNAETVLMNFCRGTGLHGLTGIPVAYGNIKRPLLIFAKDELIQFAKENKLDFVEDSSNLSSKYTRNLFRNEIIPAISKVYPQVNENLNDNISRFKETEKLYKVAVGDIKKKLVKEKGSEWHIPVKQLMGYNNKALIYEIISDFGFSEKQIDEVIKLSASDSGKFIDSPTSHYRIIRHRHWFIISPVQSGASGMIIIEEKNKHVAFQEGMIEIEGLQTSNPDKSGQALNLQTSNSIALLDSKEISFPFILRKWKAGDYFYPLGMKKKKKLSRFFIDQKFSKTEKEKTWVIEMNKKIIWIVGQRIDERFKVTEKTKSVLKLIHRPPGV